MPTLTGLICSTSLENGLTLGTIEIGMGARLYVILARRAPVGVIFRRGPSKQVQLISWNLKDDSFSPGQWLKARVYERRCDLSPGGTLLIYFAATYKKPLRSWTAISKPPWFTALALWLKGDGWNGGGYFLSQYSIYLNHFRGEAKPHPDFISGCRKIQVAGFAQFRGEDDTVWHAVLERDGWSQIDRGVWGKYDAVQGFSWKATRPELWRKRHPSLPLHLMMGIEAINQRDGPWYVIRYRILNESQQEILNLGLIDWADWSRTGDLFFSKTGCLYRQPFSKGGPGNEKILADFNSNRFEALEPPEWASKL